MRIQHNITAMNSYRNFTTNNTALSKNLEKLSSGYKVNRAGDDAAGLAISEKMRAQITGLEGATKNAKDGISLIQTAEGALTEVHSMLNRMYSLAEQSANGTYDNETDREQLNKEVQSLRSEINRIADSTNYNGIKLLNGTAGERQGSTAVTAAVNGIKSVAIYGGGDGTNVQTTGGAGTDADFTYSITGTKDNATVQMTLTEIKGVKWEAVGSGNAANGTTASINLKDLNGAGGSVTFKAVVDSTATGALAENIKRFEGMEMVVTFDSASAGGNYATAGDAVTVATLGTQSNLTLQIGDTGESFNQMTVSIKDMHSNKLNIDNVDIRSQSGAASALATIKSAINMVSDTRGTLGALQNRLDHTINNLGVMTENIQNAESAIRDTDVAEEMMKYTKNNILNQSAQAMLAQANQMPQGVLQLLQ